MLGSGAVIVIDDRCCMVQLGLRVAQFYMHESCGKCTPCREGVRWMVDILERIEQGRASRASSTCCCRRLRPHARQVPLPARRRRGDAGRELRRQVPRRVPAAHRRRRRVPSRESRRSRASSRRSTSTTRTSGAASRFRCATLGRMTRVRRQAPMSSPELVTRHDRRPRSHGAARAPGWSRRRSPPASRFPSSATSHASGPPLGACRMCLVEVEGLPKLQAACTLTAQDGMVVEDGRDERAGAPRARRQCSSSSC